MQQFRVALLTGDGLRHRFVAQRLAQSTDLIAVISEAKSSIMPQSQLLESDERRIVERHFAERDQVEQQMLGDTLKFPDTEMLRPANGTINSTGTLAWLQALNPDFVLLYGSSIIKPPLLDYYDGRMINIHLGLSPYYRGSGTNFWPLVSREPECIGATIHLAAQDVDAGAILAQVRPAAEITDRAHELGTKTIIAALDLLPDALALYAAGQLRPQPQQLGLGRTFRQKDFNAGSVQTMWQHFDTKMMAEHLDAAEERCRKYPIVDLAMALA